MPKYREDIKIRLLQAFGVETDAGLAKQLGRARGTISGWKSRGIPRHAIMLASARSGKPEQWFITGRDDSAPGRSTEQAHTSTALVVPESDPDLLALKQMKEAMGRDLRFRQAITELLVVYAGAEAAELQALLINIEQFARNVRREGRLPPREQRKHPRYSARLPARWTGRRGAPMLPGEILTVSTAGLMLAADAPPAAGDRIELIIETPAGEVRATGRIAWANPAMDGGRAGVALEPLRAAHRQRWEQTLELARPRRPRLSGGGK